MAKLKARGDKSSKPVVQAESGEPLERDHEIVTAEEVGELTMQETNEAQTSNEPVEQPTVHQTAAAVPFSIEMPGHASAPSTGGSTGNLVQRRQDQIANALLNKTFKFKELRSGQQFFCICGAEGKNAIVLEATDVNTNEVTEVLVGSSCLKHTGVLVPKQPRAKGSLAPGISKQQKFSEALGKYVAPFRFVRKQDGPFACLCGGRGTNQIVIADTNGTEFSVGNTCAEIIPGVVVPKQQREARKGMPQVAGLKGGVQAPPTFQNVS